MTLIKARSLFFIFMIIYSFRAQAQWIELDSVNNSSALTKTGNYLFVNRASDDSAFIRIDVTNNTRELMLSPFGQPFSRYGWKALASINSNIFCMDHDTLFYSNDNGNNWHVSSMRQMAGVYFFVNNDTFFLGRFLAMNMSVDGGQSFPSVYNEFFGTNSTLLPLLVKNNYIYFTEERGFMKTALSGPVAGTTVLNPRTNFPYKLVEIGDTLIASDNDTIFKSTDYGLTWSRIGVLTGGRWIYDMKWENGILYTVSDAGVNVSYNNGRTFLPINMGLPPGTHGWDLEIDSQYVYIGTTEGTYKRSKSEFLPKRFQGTVFYDANNNGVMDTNEIRIPNSILQCQYHQYVSLTDSLGHFDIWLAEPDTINYIPAESFYQFSPVNGYVVNAFGQSGNYAVQIDSTIQDLKINLTAYNASRVGRSTSFGVNYMNVGAGNVNAHIRIYLDSVYSISSVSDPLAWYWADSVFMDLIMPPFSSANFRIESWLPQNPFLNGRQLQITAYAGPEITDYSPNDNRDTIYQRVVASFDPNGKVVMPEGDIDSTFINNGEYLTYIIRFQNTGSSFAENITVKDQLSEFLDPSTLKFEGSSHNCSVGIDTLNMLSFVFENIYLPDSVHNEPLSHGYVRFRIKPKSNISEGTEINNVAAIYFDFNTPIYTDTTITRYLNPTIGINEIDGNLRNVFVFPNPSIDKINLNVEKNDQVELLTLTGQVIHSSEAKSNSLCVIDVSNLKSGVYILKVTSKEGIRQAKIIRGN